MRPGEPDRTRHQEGHVPLHSFLGGVASPVSIKDRSFTDLKRCTPILDIPPLIGHGTDGQAKTQPAHHRVLVGMHQTPWVDVQCGIA